MISAEQFGQTSLRSTRIPRGSLIAIVIAAFSPYLPGVPLHLDQVLYYAMLPILAPFFLFRVTLSDFWPLLVVGIFLLLMIMWSVFASIAVGALDYGLMRFLAATENLTKCLALTIVLTVLASESRIDRPFLRQFSLVLVLLLAANAFLSMIQIYFDLSIFLKFFQPAIDDATWTRSLTLARYIGVFNAPSQAGATYSLGLFCGLYLLDTSTSKQTTITIMIGFIIAGGMLALSKAFLFVGLPMAVIYIAYSSVLRRGFVMARLWVLFPVIGLPVIWLLSNWRGLDRLISFGPALLSSEVISELTGSRFGSGSSPIADVLELVTTKSAIWGIGFGSVQTIDSGYLLYYVYGGIVGVFLGVATYAVLLLWPLTVQLPAAERRLYGFALCVTMIVELATPILTRGIYATVFLSMVAIIIASRSQLINAGLR